MIKRFYTWLRLRFLPEWARRQLMEETKGWCGNWRNCSRKTSGWKATLKGCRMACGVSAV